MFENSNRRQFQRGLDADKQRAFRRDSQLSLRKKQREAHLQKRRKTITTQRSSPTTTNNGEPGAEQEIPPKLTDIPKFVGFIMQTENLEQQLIGTNGIRRLLSIERDPPTRQIAKSGVIPKIIQFMFTNNNQNSNNNNRNEIIIKKLQFESAWVITNIAASSSELVHYICQQGLLYFDDHEIIL